MLHGELVESVEADAAGARASTSAVSPRISTSASPADRVGVSSSDTMSRLESGLHLWSLSNASTLSRRMR
jgi:hypothetical protein